MIPPHGKLRKPITFPKLSLSPKPIAIRPCLLRKNKMSLLLENLIDCFHFPRASPRNPPDVSKRDPRQSSTGDRSREWWRSVFGGGGRRRLSRALWRRDARTRVSPELGVSRSPRPPQGWRIGGFRKISSEADPRLSNVSPLLPVSFSRHKNERSRWSLIVSRAKEGVVLSRGRGRAQPLRRHELYRETLAEKFSGSHSRENSSRGCSFEVAPTDRRRMMENKWKFFQGIYIGPARLTFPSLFHPARKFVSSWKLQPNRETTTLFRNDAIKRTCLFFLSFSFFFFGDPFASGILSSSKSHEPIAIMSNLGMLREFFFNPVVSRCSILMGRKICTLFKVT